MTHLKEGGIAPEFSAKNQEGQLISLHSMRGKKVVLYFYPKDMTPGCTVESCNLRDNYSILKDEGFEVIGVSADSEMKHQRFIKRFKLPFNLIADTDKKVVKAYGVWVSKSFFGRVFDGIHRTTFVIDEDGYIEKIITKVNTLNHTRQILEKVYQEAEAL